MTAPWEDMLASAIARGETGSQFAVPDGKYLGDPFFITDSKNTIVVVLVWDGAHWLTDDLTFCVEMPEQKP